MDDDARLCLYLSREGRDRIVALTEDHNVSQGKLFEALVFGFTDSQIDAAVSRGNKRLLELKAKKREHKRKLKESVAANG